MFLRGVCPRFHFAGNAVLLAPLTRIVLHRRTGGLGEELKLSRPDFASKPPKEHAQKEASWRCQFLRRAVAVLDLANPSLHGLHRWSPVPGDAASYQGLHSIEICIRDPVLADRFSELASAGICLPGG